MPKVWLLSLKVRFIVGSVILHFEGKVQWCGKLILIYQNFEINLKYPYLNSNKICLSWICILSITRNKVWYFSAHRNFTPLILWVSANIKFICKIRFEQDLFWPSWKDIVLRMLQMWFWKIIPRPYHVSELPSCYRHIWDLSLYFWY